MSFDEADELHAARMVVLAVEDWMDAPKDDPATSRVLSMCLVERVRRYREVVGETRAEYDKRVWAAMTSEEPKT